MLETQGWLWELHEDFVSIVYEKAASILLNFFFSFTKCRTQVSSNSHIIDAFINNEDKAKSEGVSVTLQGIYRPTLPFWKEEGLVTIRLHHPISCMLACLWAILPYLALRSIGSCVFVHSVLLASLIWLRFDSKFLLKSNLKRSNPIRLN
jgi:hypothetical protein